MNDQVRQVVIEALSLWVRGDQQGATDLIRPLADQQELPALALISWFLYQRGDPLWREGVPYAVAAARTGAPWVTGYYIGNMLNDPYLRTQVPDLIDSAIRAGWPIDPLAYAIAPFQQGDQATATELIGLTGRWPPSELMERAKTQADTLNEMVTQTATTHEHFLGQINSWQEELGTHHDRVLTQANQLKTLIDQTTNAQAQGLFEDEANRNARESRGLFWFGVAVLSTAAVISVLPLILHYIGVIKLKDSQLGAAHVTPSLALGAVAGVLLARSRGRDRARQRARDLSISLGTMFVYSNQIVEEAERQRFVNEMGRIVLESFLRQEPAHDESESLLKTLIQRKP